MKKVVVLVLIALALIGVGIWAANRPHDTTKVAGESTQKSLVAGALLVDVRTPEEFTAQHGVDAVNVPLEDIQIGTLPNATFDTPLYVYCRSGNRSKQATVLLKQAGFTNVTDIGALADLSQYGVLLVGP